jgi:anti-sigma factor RsiW
MKDSCSMNECRRIGSLLTSYVDGALPAQDRADVDRHLAACPPCRTLMDVERGGRTVLRECAGTLRNEPLPPGLKSRCEMLAREQTRIRAAAGWRSRLVPAGLAAVLVTFTAVALFSLATRGSDAVLAAQLTADHVKCFKVFVSSDAAGVDARDVEQRLESEYGWDMHVPRSVDGLRLVGARRCLYADGRVPHVMYEAGRQPVSLFMLEGVVRKAGDVVTLGHRCRIWNRGGNTFVLVAPDAAEADFTRIARYVREEAH